MPYTKRKAHYNSASTLIDYITNKEKTDEGLLTSAINCSVDMAAQEFKNNNHHWKAKGKRVAYHLIQSFYPNDDITPEQAHEIARRLCEELYPDFQCVIATHVDRDHIHNHIAINAVNLHGRKLEDRLANQKEGLYGYKEASDRIAQEYGCFVLPAQKIEFHKKKNYYYEYKSQTWRETIKNDIDFVKEKCSSTDELLDELVALGYEIKLGKYPAIRTTGMKKFIRFYSLDEGYTLDDLEEYFGTKAKPKVIQSLRDITVTATNFNEIRLAKAKESREAILRTSKHAVNNQYSEYQKTRYKEIRRFYQLKNELETMQHYDINSYKDLSNHIEELRANIKSQNEEIQKLKKENKDILLDAEKAQDFIRLFSAKEYAEWCKSIDKDFELPDEVKVFLKIQEELGITTIPEAREIIDQARNVRLTIHEMQSSVVEKQRELNSLDIIKEEQLIESNLFIHNIKFGANRINFDKSTDLQWCINLPYSDKYIMIDKDLTTFNNKNNFYTLFLIDDEKYDIYTAVKEKDTSNSTETEQITLQHEYQLTGTQLEDYVLSEKEKFTKIYAEKNNLEQREEENQL